MKGRVYGRQGKVVGTRDKRCQQKIYNSNVGGLARQGICQAKSSNNERLAVRRERAGKKRIKHDSERKN